MDREYRQSGGAFDAHHSIKFASATEFSSKSAFWQPEYYVHRESGYLFALAIEARQFV